VTKHFRAGTPFGDAVDVLVDLVEEVADEAAYAIEKAAPDQRYTFGPLYSPGAIDAHGEYSTADDLQKAVWDFNLSTDLTLRKQHGAEKIGKVVELVQWPFPHEAELGIPGRLAKNLVLPARTVYAGVVWEPRAWPLVKSGQITGLSMGGTAVRLRNAADDADLVKFS
jgi:hypothetical protein